MMDMKSVLVLFALLALSAWSAESQETCAELKQLAEHRSNGLAPELQGCEAYIVTKCCDQHTKCSPSDSLSQCYRECAAVLEAAGDKQLVQCGKSKRSLFVKRRLRKKRKNRKRGKGRKKRKGKKGLKKKNQVLSTAACQQL